MDVLLVFLAFGAVMVLGPLLALVSLFKRTDEEVAGGSRALWGLVVLVIPLAWVVYFLLGRRDGGSAVRA